MDSGRRSLTGAAAAAPLLGAAAAASGLIPGLQAAVYAGSDKPEKDEVRIGFIPLTDRASVVMASALGFDKKYDVKIVATKEASWASVRNTLVNSALEIARALYGLIYGVHLGTSGPKKSMAVLMTLHQNGQAITLSKKLADKRQRHALPQGHPGLFVHPPRACGACRLRLLPPAAGRRCDKAHRSG